MQAFTKKSFSSLIRARITEFFPRQNYATRKRFYRNTSIVQNDSKWEVTLDHRRLKTPNGRVLSVSNEPLARAIAAEWDAQLDQISQPTMHLTALCNTAIDNPGKLTKHDIASYLLDFLPTDTLLFHSEEEDSLRALQEKEWTPVLEWFQKRFNVTQETSKGLALPPVATETRAVLARYLLSYDFPSLNEHEISNDMENLTLYMYEAQLDKKISALCFGVEAVKSLLLMVACVERHLEPKQAVLLSRLEEEYQASRWGRVPWAHELSQAELTARVAAALLVVAGGADSHSARAKSTPPETA